MNLILKRFGVVALLASAGLTWAGEGSGSVTAPEPRRVTLQDKEFTLGATLKEIKAQTGIDVVSKVDGKQVIGDLDLKKVPFWQALDTVAAKANAFVVPSDPVTLQALAPNQEAPPVSYSGIFRTTIKRINVSKDLISGVTSCTAVLEVAWEPGARMFYLTQDSGKTEVRDQANNLLKGITGVKTERVTEKSSWEVEVRLPVLPRKAEQYGLVTGRVMVSGTPRMQSVSFPDLTKGQAKGAGSGSGSGTTVKLVDAELKKDLWNVKVEVSHDEDMPLFESWQSWVFQDEIVVEPVSGGAKLELEGMEVDLREKKGTLTYRFSPPGGKKQAGNVKDWKMTYLTAGRIMETPVDFSFREVKLP
jgi:hypothetical protein